MSGRDPYCKWRSFTMTQLPTISIRQKFLLLAITPQKQTYLLHLIKIMPKLVYCITPVLDGHVMLPDRTPRTWTMTSLNICGMAFYDLWYPHPHPSLFTSIHPFCSHPDCFCLSWPPADKAYSQLIPVKLGYDPQISWPQPDLWHLSMWRKCGECIGGGQTTGTLKETRCHSETIEVPLMENCI